MSLAVWLRPQFLVALAVVWIASIQGRTEASGQAQSAYTVHVVRVGVGKVGVMKQNILDAVQACQVIKKLPVAAPALPSDSYLAKLAVMEEEEYFDGQLWASYTTQRSIGADALSGCKLTLFSARSADVERTCESRIRGNTTLMGEMQSVTEPKEPEVEIADDVLPGGPCKGVVRPMDLSGLPRFDAGLARCVWSGDYLAKLMAKYGGGRNDGSGFDTCVYELQPEYIYQGHKRPVILLKRSVNNTGTVDRLDRDLGEVQAFGNLSLKTFSAGTPLDKSVFTRAGVQAFLSQAAKTSPGGE